MKFFLVYLIIFTLYGCDNQKDIESTEVLENKLQIASSEISRLSIKKYDNFTKEEKIKVLESDRRFNGYIIRDLSRAYFLTKDEEYKNIANDLFNIYKESFEVNGILQSQYFHNQGSWYRDTFTREMNLLYQSYLYLNNKDILSTIEEQISLWLVKVKRDLHNEYIIFPYGINLIKDELHIYEINPNQNLAIARLFSNLYFERNSKFFKNQLFKEIIINEVNAALSLQNENGSLPLREELPLVLDSNYGGFASTMLYDIVQMWPNKVWIKKLKKIGRWLYNDFPMNHPWNMKEDYPNYRQDRFYAYNLISRLSSFYIADIDSTYAKEWVLFIQEKFPNDNLRFETRWIESLSIPRSYYLDNEIIFNIKPKVYISDDNTHIFINIIGESISSYEILLNGEHFNNESLTPLTNEVNTLKVLYKQYDKDYSYLEVLKDSNNKNIIVNIIDKEKKIE